MDFLLGVVAGGAVVWVYKWYFQAKVEAVIDTVKTDVAKVVTTVHEAADGAKSITTTTEETVQKAGAAAPGA